MKLQLLFHWISENLNLVVALEDKYGYHQNHWGSSSGHINIFAWKSIVIQKIVALTFYFKNRLNIKMDDASPLTGAAILNWWLEPESRGIKVFADTRPQPFARQSQLSIMRFK